MAGGLLNIISVGNNNVILTGNPSKTFFKVTYSKYTNFGLQKFRIDYDGLRELRLTEQSVFSFKIPRYAELLMDAYIAVTLPDIWSPVHNPVSASKDSVYNTDNRWAPYDFRWIQNIGALMIKEITITCGSLLLQRYTGEYISAMVDRDFTNEKKELFNKMTGNVPELNDPGNAFHRENTYPSAFYTENSSGAEPSIRGRQLYIPLNAWFMLNPGCAIPLICLQYNELVINVTFRPIQELFQVRDVYDNVYQRPYVQPDFTLPQFQMYRFLQTPPAVDIALSNYENKTNTWNADVHLLATYCFLSKEETQTFAAQDHVYLVKDIFQYNFENITGTQRLKLNSNGMIASWMWYLQRNDVNLRNEWSNYTNWPYDGLPSPMNIITSQPIQKLENTAAPSSALYIYDKNSNTYYSLANDPNDGRTTGIVTVGDYAVQNKREILENMGILLNGEYRENILTRGVYDYIEKYTRTNGSAQEGLYCYNFCLNTNPFEYQPSGALNLSKFKNIELEITTHVPPVDSINSSFDVICDADGNPIGVRKSNWRLYDYNYNMTLFEERYNILSFISGNCGMLYAR
uniref:Major capsid protein N-terminal domain-containing protein n=1 Tax=viral metagenome TaxID=1070528 RepID=A0A6C0DNC4_9ZZZZ